MILQSIDRFYEPQHAQLNIDFKSLITTPTVLTHQHLQQSTPQHHLQINHHQRNNFLPSLIYTEVYTEAYTEVTFSINRLMLIVDLNMKTN